MSGNCSVESLEVVLGKLRSLSGDIESCAVLARDGRLLASEHGEGVDRERAAAMLSALADMAGRTARESGREHAAQVRVRTELGYVLLVRLEDGGTLAATTGPEARVGLVLYDMRGARVEVHQAMEEGQE